MRQLMRHSHQRELDPAELLLVGLLRRALKDAECGNENLRTEATAWLWWFAPHIAQRAGVEQHIAADNALYFR